MGGDADFEAVLAVALINVIDVPEAGDYTESVWVVLAGAEFQVSSWQLQVVTPIVIVIDE